MREAGISRPGQRRSAAARRSACPASGSPTTSSSATFAAGGAEPALGRRHHLPAEPGRAGSTSPPSRTLYSRRIVGWSDGRSHARRARRRRARDGPRAPPARARADPSLRPGQPVRRRSPSASRPAPPASPLDGQPRRLLRQRRRRELLRDAQEGAHPPPLLADQAELRTEVFDYIEVFYNRQRRHSRSACARPRTSRTALSAPTVPGLAASRLASPQTIRLTSTTPAAVT